jgi:hypothetical protein
VVHQLDLGEIKEKKKKKVQYIVVFSLLREGHPLMDYKSLKHFFAFPNSKTCPRFKKHWFNNLGWAMVRSIYDVVLECTKEVIKKFPFLVISTLHLTLSLGFLSMGIFLKIGNEYLFC